VAPKSESKSGSMTQPGLSEMFAYHATTMANTISTSLVVFSRKVGFSHVYCQTTICSLLRMRGTESQGTGAFCKCAGASCCLSHAGL